MDVFDNVLEAIGKTPLVRLNKCVPDGPHTFYGKVEFLNPGGSVKDRIALNIIRCAEERGELKPGGTIIEATSGNTGFGLALVAAVKGYNCIITIPDKMSDEKVNMLRAVGAKVIVTPSAVEPEDPRSLYSVAKKLAEVTPNSFLANQYHNPDNVAVHYETTGPELWEQMDGKIDAFFGGAGTGGTISGVGRYLKEKNKDIKVVCTDPVGSILYDLFYHGEVRTGPQPYKVEGIGEDMLPDNVHFKVIDDFVQVADKPAFLKCRELLNKEGLFVGPSAGCALSGAIEWSKQFSDPMNIVVLLPDSGDRYLSKAFNDSWMKENGFIDSPLQLRTVRDLVLELKKSQDLVIANTSDSVLSVIQKLKENALSQLPVYSEGNLVGLVDESDLLMPLASGEITPNDTIFDFVKSSIITVDLDEPLQKLVDLFGEGYVALAEDENKNLMIITKIDLIEFLGDN